MMCRTHSDNMNLRPEDVPTIICFASVMLSEGNSGLIQEMHSVLSVYLCSLKVLEVLQDDFYVIKEVLGRHRGV